MGQCRRLGDQISFWGPSPSPSATDRGCRRARAFTGIRSLAIRHGKACGSRSSVLACSVSQVKFQQSFFCFLMHFLQCLSERRTLRVQSSPTASRTRRYVEQGTTSITYVLWWWRLWKLGGNARNLLQCSLEAVFKQCFLTPVLSHTRGLWTLFYPLCYLLPFSGMKWCHISQHSFPWQQPRGSGNCWEQRGPSPANAPIWGGTREAGDEAGVQLPTPTPHGDNAAFPVKGTSWRVLPSRETAWPFADSVIS